MEDSNSLDLTDGLEDRVQVPFVYTRDHAEWLTADGQASFARGTEASVEQSQEDVHAAMAMKDTLSSPFGLDSACPTLGLSDVRAQPPKKDDGYPTLESEGDLPDTTAIIRTLMSHRDLITNNQMIYLIVDNRMPTDVPHWPAFAAWWASRRCLVGPQEEATDILWVCADATTGLHKVPYYWAGVFVLEAARFLYPAQHFALIDNDCVPVTLFEVQDLLQLAHQQHQWVDLLGRARSESSSCAGIGVLLFTEAHLEYNAGLVISIGNRSKHSPLEHDATASTLAKNLQAGRLALVSRARPPVNQTALDLCMVWSLYGLYMCKHFWPSPVIAPNELGPGSTIKWPRQSHPRALTPAGRERTPWVTSRARATFEQGILSVLPMLTGPCTVASLPGEHLFQASALPRNRMRPAIFHAFGKAKVGAQAALRELEQQGWETLPIAILGMPNLPPAWAVETWKPVGGCKFTGYFSGVAGNSALRFCLLLKWRAIRPQATELFPAQLQGDSLSCLPAEVGDADVESVSTPSSDTSAKRADRLANAIESDSTQGSQAPNSRPCTPCPQQLSPPLFVPWSQVAKLRGVVAVHKDIEACPYEELQVALAHSKCLVPGEKEQFLQGNSDLLCQLQGVVMPLEGIAPQVFEAIYQRQQGEILWVTVLWMIAQLNEYWLGGTSSPLPTVFQINCGGLGGGALEGEVPPHFHCTCPPVGESPVYGPSLSPADVLDEQEWGVAYGWSTGVHEVATLFALTQNPCQKWEDLGYGKAALLYQRTQHVLQAARLLPAHRRLPHQAFLSGLWWKLLSLEPLRLLAYLPVLGCLRPAEQADPPHFTVNGFSAGSYTGAVIALAIRCLWPASQITARLGAIAMPKSVLAALVATAEPDRRNYYLVHAAQDCLCDWKPTENELDMLQRSLRITYVTDSARWMGKHKHCYWHWLQCQLPKGKVSLTTLKLTRPDVVPRRDRIAAPMRLASWIRFETVTTSDDWEGAISLLVSNLHRPDQELLVLLQSCVAGQPIASMEEAQALLLKNFRVGKGNPSACAKWLTEMARDLLAPIPFREVFVILALFLPQLTFVDEATTRQELWSSPTVRKFGLVVEVTPTATGLQGMHEYRIAFPSGSQAAIFCPAHFQSCNFEQLASSPSSTVHMGSQAGKAYRIVLEEHGACYSVLALLLAFVSPSRKRKGDESPSEKLRRLSSPRHWDVALVPCPEDFAPLPTPTETGLACPAPWAFPPSLCVLEPRATKLRVLAIAEAGDTVTADHLLQMASLAAEHKPTVLGIPDQVPIPYQLECTVVLLQSLHALFQLLTSGNTMQHCPQAASFAVALGTAARQDNGHIVSMAASLALALRAGRSTLAVAGVFGAGKTRSLTFLLAWLALTTHLKIAVVHKENPAGRAITKLLTAFDLEPDHQRYFIRPVSREEAETNAACTDYDLRASDAASYIPGCHVVIVTTGLVWDQKGQTHSTLNSHMENVDLLISEEAQQDMDLKSAFAPTVPRQPFFRLLLGDPKQSPGGVADGQRAHRTLLLKAPIGLRAPTTWYMPHEIPGVFHMLIRHGRGFGLSDLEKTAKVVGHKPLGSRWFRPEKVQATSSFACQLQSTYKDLSRVDLALPEGLLVGLGYAAISPDSPLDFRQAQTAAERSGVASPHCWSLMLPTSARVAQEVYEPLIGIQYPMLCSRMGDTWQIGTTSIREDHWIATGLRFVHWCHASPNVQARQNPNNDPTVRVYQHLEDQLTKAGSDTDDILALTTTREGATNLRNYFSIAGKKANAETAVKVAGAAAKHCIVIHGVSTFLSGEGRNLDFDQECFTRANVAYSRATDLTILACPLNMQGMPGALQVLAALLHGVQTIYTYEGNKEPDILGSSDLTATQVAQATAFFQQALLPHPMWLGPLPVCLAEHHHGKVRRLRLVLATLTHGTKAEIASLLEGPYLPGGTVLHNLVYGYAADASLEPEWLVITDGQQPGRWRLLHNSSGPGQRCSVGSSLRYQPMPSTREQRSAQDYTFEALHRVYFYDAWRVQPVLDAPDSDLVLPPKPGLLEHGCYWPRPNLTPEVLSVSDRDSEKEEQEVQEGQSLSSLAVTDAAMAEEDANEAVSIHSYSSESPTIPSTEQTEDDDEHMADDASASTSSAEEEGDCLSNRPAPPDACPAQDEILEAEDDAGSELPPQDVDPPSSSPTSHSSESPIKRRPGSKASVGRAQSKKLRKSLAPTSRQPLGSIPEHEQPPATLADLASRNAQTPVAPAGRNPETPPDHPASAQERPQAMTEIDIASDQENAERGGTADTDLQLESEQRATQALYDYQNAAQTASETARQRVPLPALQIYSDLPREWPMARLAISSKQINRLVRIGEAFAAPLSNLFAFVKSGHPACSFIAHKQLALYASPRFWQYGLLAFIARCCSFDNQHRHQGPGTAQAEEGKSQTTKEKDVDALTFMRTVIMSFVRGMEHGEQTLPTNDLFVYLPVQILPDLVVAMERQGFTPAEVKGGYGYRPKEEDAEDNPLLVVGVHTKDIVYDRYPRMPDTSWAERAYSSGALDPSLGQAFSFPSLLQLRLRIEVPLWRDPTTARHPTADLPAGEDSASDATGSAERSPRLALPVPVGLAEPPEDGTEEATEDEDTAAEPSYAFAKGYGRFGIGYTRLATALGNFEQGNIEAESAVVAQWLTSGLRVAMSRTGWHLLSPRYMLTKVPGSVLSDYYNHGYPLTPKMADRPYNQYGPHLYSKERWDQLCAWLTGNPNFRFQLADHKQALRDHMGYSQEASDPSNKARRTVPPPGAGSSSTAAGSSWHNRPPHRPRPMGGPMGGGSKAVDSRGPPTQQPSPCRSILSKRWMALATLLLVV